MTPLVNILCIHSSMDEKSCFMSPPFCRGPPIIDNRYQMFPSYLSDELSPHSQVPKRAHGWWRRWWQCQQWQWWWWLNEYFAVPHTLSCYVNLNILGLSLIFEVLLKTTFSKKVSSIKVIIIIVLKMTFSLYPFVVAPEEKTYWKRYSHHCISRTWSTSLHAKEH